MQQENNTAGQCQQVDNQTQVTDETAQLSGEKKKYMARSRSFVSRERALTASLEAQWPTLAAQYLIDVPRGAGATAVREDLPALDLAQIFGRTADVKIEIGSGNGDQIVAAAAQEPDVDFIAFEVYHFGVAKTMAKANKAGLTNLRILEVDAAQALPILFAPGTVSEVWTFFPDPWRKARHHKRRLVSDSFAPEIARVLKPGGIWRLATDWSDYAFWMRDVLENSADFTNPYEGQNPCPELDPRENVGGFSPRWDGRTLTSFERKGMGLGRIIFDLTAVKK